MTEGPTERQQEVLEAYGRLQSIRKVADELGIHHSTVWDVLKRARRNVPPGIADALEQTGLDGTVARFGYRKVKDPETGSFNTVMWKMPGDEIAALDRIRAALEGLEPIEAIPPPLAVTPDLLTLYPLADVHLGQLSWGRESGEDYDMGLASRQLRETMAGLIVGCPESDTAVILNTGDFFHANDDKSQTDASKHPLDVDGRIYKVLETGIALTADLIEGALRKHRSVIYRALRGNHDPTMHMGLTLALVERYRHNPRVTIEQTPADFWVYEWGRCLLAAHHGDKAKPEAMTLWLAEHDLWKPKQFRHLFAGHLHHDAAKDIGGVRFERLRAFTAKDAYAAGNAYAARRSLQAITFHKDRGEVARVKRHL